MTQRAQIIDITKSFLPGDPNAFVQNLINTDREDGEEKAFPVLPFEGYNFLPTAYGYKSYFGTNSKLGLSALTSRVQFVLSYQLPTYKTRLIALCEDGIWTAAADGQWLNWTHQVTHTFDPDVYEEWTWCVIENVLYMYKQGKSVVYKTSIGTVEVTPLVPEVPAVPGDPIAIPNTTVTDTLAGDDSFFVAGDDYLVYMQYTDLTNFGAGADYLSVALIPADIGTSISITLNEVPPAGATHIRIYLNDDITGEAWIKDIPVGSFPLLLATSADMATWTYDAVFDPLTEIPAATLLGPGTPLIPAVPAVSVTNDLLIATLSPTFLNMSGQLGIFRAGTRLGFWDSANSVAWSSNLDLADFTPSIENLAGNTIFGSIVGRIVTVQGHGDGYIIYTTKSIIGATFVSEGNLLWDGKEVLSDTGIANSRAVTTGQSDSEHFVFTISGIVRIGKYTAITGKHEVEWILPELYDLLKESRDPIYLSVLQDRYLCFSLVNPDYIYGRQSFYYGAANPYYFNIDWYLPSDDHALPTVELLPTQIYEIIRDQMSGGKKKRSDNRIWVPKFTTTVDRMDTRYYAFWMSVRLGNETAGLIDYNLPASLLTNTVPPLNLITADIANDLEAQRPTSPPDAFRYGRLRTFTGIRDHFATWGGDIYDNNWKLVFNQEDEWDAFQKHSLKNKEALAGITDLEENILATTVQSTYTVGNGYTILTTDPVLGATYPTHVRKEIGKFITGEGNNEWLTTEGPYEFSAKEFILRRAFNKKYKVTRDVSIVYDPVVPWTATIQDTTLSMTIPLLSTSSTPSPVYMDPSTFNGLTASNNVSLTGAVTALMALLPSSLGGESVNLTALYALFPSGVSDAKDFVYKDLTYTTLIDNHPGPYHIYANSFDRYNNAFSGGVWVRTLDMNIPNIYTALGTDDYRLTVNATIGQPITATVTTTYEVEEIAENAGYSQYRALITHWDLIEPGIYGNYDIIQTIPADTMTPKIWDNHFPDDPLANVTSYWAYSEYRALRPTNLQEGTIGDTVVYTDGGNPLATAPPSGSSTTGITNRNTPFVLPGSSYLLQTGSIEASYPTFTGSLVFDLQLKKWGKYKGDHKVLVETIPLNASAFGTVSYSSLGVEAGIWAADGFLYTFDNKPGDSWIKYGKIGQYRLGMTNLLEVRVSMRDPYNYTVITESSMDGKMTDASLATISNYADSVVAEAYMDISARWHTVRISGNYDLTGLEIRSTISGRR